MFGGTTFGSAGTYDKIEGANHFFDKHEADVVEIVKEYVSNRMNNPHEGR